MGLAANIELVGSLGCTDRQADAVQKWAPTGPQAPKVAGETTGAGLSGWQAPRHGGKMCDPVDKSEARPSHCGAAAFGGSTSEDVASAGDCWSHEADHFERSTVKGWIF